MTQDSEYRVKKVKQGADSGATERQLTELLQTRRRSEKQDGTEVDSRQPGPDSE